MSSGKQKAKILKEKRAKKRQKEKQKELEQKKAQAQKFINKVPASERVNRLALAPSNSYGEPMFVTRGYYVDYEFSCKDCNSKEIWRATQQKWWYEVAKGSTESGAVRCSACRKKKREHRRRSLEGMEKKAMKKVSQK